MSQAHDPDVLRMTPGELRRALMRLRRGIRKHRDAENDARCWHNDLQLYALLPEGKPAGRMTRPEAVLLRRCRQYIRRQQCTSHGCRRRDPLSSRRSLPLI